MPPARPRGEPWDLVGHKTPSRPRNSERKGWAQSEEGLKWDEREQGGSAGQTQGSMCPPAVLPPLGPARAGGNYVRSSCPQPGDVPFRHSSDGGQRAHDRAAGAGTAARAVSCMGWGR